MGDRRQREAIRRRGGATYRLVRYADDFVVCVSGGREHAEALVGEIAQALAPLDLRLSREKTRVGSIDEGFDFLGFAIKRVRGRHGRAAVHTYASRRSLQAVKAKSVRSPSTPAPTRHPTGSSSASTAC
jgi:RNA-directed DNA polymerase